MKFDSILLQHVDPQQRLEEFRKLLKKAINEDESGDSLTELVSFLASEASNSSVLSLARQLFVELGTSANATGISSTDGQMIKGLTEFEIPENRIEHVLNTVLEHIQRRSVSFEEAISAIRERLASYHQSKYEWVKAAVCLSGIPLDSGHRVVPEEYKIRILLDISYLYLEEEDFVSAEVYLNRASLLLGRSNDSISQLRYKAAFVRILDFKRKFIEASHKYYELSFLSPDDDDKFHSLNQAVICAILATAGHQRSRQLGLLYKDERSSSLPIHGILEKIFMESIIREPMIEEFSRQLGEHHLAILADGSTVLNKAMMEHNFQAISRIYDNIYLSELSNLLNITLEKAEDTSARMIEENRVPGFIDRIEGIVYFNNSTATQLDEDCDQAMHNWDGRIKQVCDDLETLNDSLFLSFNVSLHK